MASFGFLVNAVPEQSQSVRIDKSLENGVTTAPHVRTAFNSPYGSNPRFRLYILKTYIQFKFHRHGQKFVLSNKLERLEKEFPHFSDTFHMIRQVWKLPESRVLGPAGDNISLFSSVLELPDSPGQFDLAYFPPAPDAMPDTSTIRTRSVRSTSLSMSSPSTISTARFGSSDGDSIMSVPGVHSATMHVHGALHDPSHDPVHRSMSVTNSPASQQTARFGSNGFGSNGCMPVENSTCSAAATVHPTRFSSLFSGPLVDPGAPAIPPVPECTLRESGYRTGRSVESHSIDISRLSFGSVGAVGNNRVSYDLNYSRPYTIEEDEDQYTDSGYGSEDEDTVAGHSSRDSRDDPAGYIYEEDPRNPSKSEFRWSSSTFGVHWGH